ncbi:hypothetical protein SCALM49S_06531 [Streptomyces californicus]
MGGAQGAVDAAQERGLAAAVGADEADGLAVRRGEVDGVDEVAALAGPVRESFGAQGGHGRAPSGRGVVVPVLPRRGRTGIGPALLPAGPVPVLGTALLGAGLMRVLLGAGPVPVLLGADLMPVHLPACGAASTGRRGRRSAR